MSKIMICPSCNEEVEIKKIRTGERISYKYMTFTKAVGVCPKCLSEIHIPEIDNIIENLQKMNKEYVNILKEYDDSSPSIDKDFSKDWDTITPDRLIFENVNDEDEDITITKCLYNGTLKTEFGYDIVQLDSIYYNTIKDIQDVILNHDEEDTDPRYYYFKTYVAINNELREVCCMMWEDLNKSVSGIIFNKDDTTSYRYGKQKTKDKYVII